VGDFSRGIWPADIVVSQRGLHDHGILPWRAQMDSRTALFVGCDGGIDRCIGIVRRAGILKRSPLNETMPWLRLLASCACFSDLSGFLALVIEARLEC
jgi:hypothetical protein